MEIWIIVAIAFIVALTLLTARLVVRWLTNGDAWYDEPPARERYEDDDEPYPPLLWPEG